ncbi:Uncharacterised protein [Mycobacterium tuberculosis]|uniref:Uncharacterized protein n=1 Tax=Mycobacterium tuberculosis TaxID=1773 RepID=A0A0U0R1G3_MYCTX|nr:Uncharacterised protein [Mycobacterium tuberculosis]COW87834.1 Uncharacterised protein [Mycobacterium tuberculosis]
MHHTAHHQPVQAQADGPQQQGAAIEPPCQPEGLAQHGPGGAGAGAFGDQSGTDITAGA